VVGFGLHDPGICRLNHVTPKFNVQRSISARNPPFTRPSVVMISTIKSSDEPRSTLDRALRNYSRTTGIDLTNHPSVDKFQNCHSPDDVVQLLLERKNAFESDRDKYRDLIDRLLPVVQIVCELSGVVDGPADLVSLNFSYLIRSKFSPQLPLQLTKAIFVGIDVLFSVRISLLPSFWPLYGINPPQATVDIRANYDALLDLFECVADLLKHLRIFTEKIPLSSTMSSVMVMIMVETLSVLAVATKQMNSERFGKWLDARRSPIADRGTEKFANKLGGEICVAAILQKLDRLTLEEARVTVAPTLKVVHGLLNNLKIVIDGAQYLSDCMLRD
jgi:hypothetical protein